MLVASILWRLHHYLCFHVAAAKTLPSHPGGLVAVQILISTLSEGTDPMRGEEEATEAQAWANRYALQIFNFFDFNPNFWCKKWVKFLCNRFPRGDLCVTNGNTFSFHVRLSGFM